MLTDQNQIDEFGYNTNRYFSWNWENTIEIKQEFGKNNFTLLGGTSAYDWNQNSFGFSKKYLGGSVNNETPPNMLLGSTGDIAYANNEGWNSFSYRRYASVFGRLNYEYDDKYFLTATLRRDGSSRFGSAYKFDEINKVEIIRRIIFLI